MDKNQNIEQDIELITRELGNLKAACITNTTIQQLENEIGPLKFRLKFFSKNPNFKIFYMNYLHISSVYILEWPH